MSYKDNQFIIAQDLSFVGVLHDIKKSKTALQPIFECFTNALEAIKIKQNTAKSHKGEITIRINASETTVQSTELNGISITDNGIGFNDEEFKRFNTFKLTNKGFKNLGSGRIQYVHYFDTTTIKSVFEQGGKFFEREFVVSKREDFLKQNAIVKHRICKESIESTTGATVTFSTLLENSVVYNDLNENTIKEKLLERYIHYFCYNKTKLPKIKIEFYVQSVLKGESTISQIDIPSIDKTKTIPLQYSKKSKTGIDKIDKTEDFTIDAFKVSKNLLKENKLNLVSKGEVIEESDVSLQSLAGSDIVKGNKYLFLVSSNYIDARDTNLRGVLNIPNKESFEKDLFASQEEILVEDIQEELNNSINTMYPEIEEVKQKHQEGFAKLKEMFLLDDDTAKDISVSINDSETDILKKFYEAEAKKAASMDAAIKESIDNLEKLDTRNPNYVEELEKEINRLVRSIPLQNKKTLTHYVARRKLVLDLLDKILGRKLQVQQQKENYDEALIHNLLFQKGSTNTENSDLWIINEDFIYFKGSSEKQLSQLEIDGQKVFKDKFTEEEERYLTSLSENRKIKRPDVLLFPEEGKCIIIEFKAPHVNASDHLTQIDRYANLIRNYTEDKFQITTFYGYLLGESIEPRDVLGTVSRYEHSYQFDYLYRPAENVIGFDGRTNGSIYTEVIRYTTLLERAKQRNKIFIEKLK
jgi:tRNA threonylcarbamoyladenosine modification (KEOPS) complex Cgi121 subunit